MSPKELSLRGMPVVVVALLAILAGGYLWYVRFADSALVSRREIESMRADISHLKRENARLQRQLAAVADRAELHGGGSPNVAGSSSSKAPTNEVPVHLAARVSRLKEYLSAHPEVTEPEMRLLKDDDWFNIVRDMRVDTEASERKALAFVRMEAQLRLGGMIAAAVRDYIDDNNGQPPSSAAQLAPFLADPANADLLQGFEKADSNAPEGSIFQKVSAVDDWYGSTSYIGDNYCVDRSTGPGLAVEEAIAGFKQATGNAPSDASQIAPYLHEAVNPSTVNAVLAGLRPSPNAPPVLAGSRGMTMSSGANP
jgi:hypothetical protein